MITVEEALGKILSYVNVLDSERKPILESVGQVLNEDVYATIDVPSVDSAAMDGYAVQADSTCGASESLPRTLRVIWEATPGHISRKEVMAGVAIRIMTGSPIPKGADAVVRFEDTDEVQRRVTGEPLSQIGILREIHRGLNVKQAGEDSIKGHSSLKRGTLLRVPEIGLLASLGRPEVLVTRRPHVAILATGNELLDINKASSLGKTYDSNSFTLATQVYKYGGIPKILGIARDNAESLAKKIEQGLDSDLFIISGGMSIGEYDIVKHALAQHGEIVFCTVRVKPGRHLAFGVLMRRGKQTPCLGLPGNPVSSMVTFELYARPAIFKMLGRGELEMPTIPATFESHIENVHRCRIFDSVNVRKEDGRYFARLTGIHGSGVINSMVRANGIVIIPEDLKLVDEGDTVQVWMLD